ncbi:MAG TPA: glycosyltransferase [Bryobacteraceae bacterium]|nr:glycosyltransferase [Bryobacteraceae bacterium]
MDNADKLAVLMPVFNGGTHLLRSISSCSSAGLSGDEYELLVVDNCSTDGAVDGLSSRDAAGAPVHVFRNDRNLGRVGNWNRSVELAIELGYRNITFLFAGDCWRSGPALRELMNRVRHSQARVGFAPFIVTDSSGVPKYQSRRFYVTGDTSVVCSARDFLATMLDSGMFPLGPLQANLYRVDPSNPLRFDPSIPRRADVQATLDFVHNTNGQIVITSAPFLEWREHAGRFHASMGCANTIEDYMETFHTACRQSGLPANHARAKARVVLNSCRLILKEAPATEWPTLIRVIAACSRRSPYSLTPLHLLETLWSRFALGRRLLQFG